MTPQSTSTPSHYDRLDHLRFFAASLLILHHFRGQIDATTGYPRSIEEFLSTWLRWGSTGVTLFIVLSGFLFTVLCDAGNKKINYKNFMLNRVLRIFPLLIFVFIIIQATARAQFGPDDIFRLLFLQMNTGHTYTGHWHEHFPIGPIWTVAVEFQFYALFPLILILYKRNGIGWLLGLTFVTFLIKPLLIILNGAEIYYNLYHTLAGRITQFLIGMLIAILYLKNKLRLLQSPALGAITITACITILTKIISLNHGSKAYATLSLDVEAIVWGLLLAAYLSINIHIPKIINKILKNLGALSFSMYLLHLAIGTAVLRITPDQTSNNSIDRIAFILPAILAPTIIISALTYIYIEKPFLRLKKSYLKEDEA